MPPETPESSNIAPLESTDASTTRGTSQRDVSTDGGSPPPGGRSGHPGGIPDTASGSVPAGIGLYSTQGQLITATTEMDARDERVSAYFGSKVVGALTSSWLYLQVKLVEPPQRPQTYYLRTTVPGESLPQLVDQLEAFIADAGYEHAGPGPGYFERVLSTPRTETDLDGDLDALAIVPRGTITSAAPFVFRAENPRLAFHLTVRLNKRIGVAPMLVAGRDADPEGIDDRIKCAAIVSVDRSAKGLSMTADTRKQITHVVESARKRRRDAALESIREGISALMEVEDSDTTRQLVLDCAPTPQPRTQSNTPHRKGEARVVTPGEASQRGNTASTRVATAEAETRHARREANLDNSQSGGAAGARRSLGVLFGSLGVVVLFGLLYVALSRIGVASGIVGRASTTDIAIAIGILGLLAITAVTVVVARARL